MANRKMHRGGERRGRARKKAAGVESRRVDLGALFAHNPKKSEPDAPAPRPKGLSKSRRERLARAKI